LDIFAHCIRSPLLSISCADRELRAIDSEFSLARNDDGARLQEITNLVCAKDGHVTRKFSWGNKQSLKTLPEGLSIDVHSALKKFHTLHYRPENCKLVVVAPWPLDQIRGAVESSFSGWTAAPLSSLTAHESEADPKEEKAEKNRKRRKPNVSAPSSSPLTLQSMLATVSPFHNMSPFTDESGGIVTRSTNVKNVHKL
jgi:secreted Zn-dependent insulinase-like peptidase